MNNSYVAGSTGPMRRRLFNLAAALSLVVCLALLTLWTVGQWRIVSIREGLRSNYFDKKYEVEVTAFIANGKRIEF